MKNGSILYAYEETTKLLILQLLYKQIGRMLLDKIN